METFSSRFTEPSGLIPAARFDHIEATEYLTIDAHRVVVPVACAGRAPGHRCVPIPLPSMRLCPVGHSLVSANVLVLSINRRSSEPPAAVASGSIAA